MMISGTLTFVGTVLKVKFINQNGNEVSSNISEAQMSSSFSRRNEAGWRELEGISVEIEVERGVPVRVRPQGQTWLSPNNQALPGHQQVNNNAVANHQQAVIQGDFHNPYNFVPALPRNGITNELSDRPPVGHSQYLPEYWSGSIQVELTTKTPLLLPDASKMYEGEVAEHKIYPMRVLDEKTYLPITSFKGMLRSAYEAVTNSRLSIFGEEHDERLFYRMSASEGLSLVPAIVENGGIRLMQGTTTDYPYLNYGRWRIPGNLMYAAWLPSYYQQTRNNLSRTNLQHGDRVRVWLEQYQKKNHAGTIMFKHWRVTQMVAYNQNLGIKPATGREYGSYSPVKNVEMIQTDGYLCITGNNINSKHDERVFFNSDDYEALIYNLDELSKDWKYLIQDYQKLHENETRDEGLEWSRQVIGGDREHKLVSSDRPTLCYAFVDTSGDRDRITALYPVMISRAIYSHSPSELLSPDDLDYCLKPATSIDRLSPADRVFGWVNQSGDGAYKGQLRITAVSAPEKSGIENFNPPLALAILGEPKPQQSRFYAAKDIKGTPLDPGSDKSKGYSKGGGIRGRKVYPHHQTSSEYWNAENRTIPVGDRSREYLSVEQQQSSQNKSIEAWVKPEEKFVFNIDIVNLSSIELGALLWLLTLDNDHYFRLGSGKPLGFGSTHLKVIESKLGQGKDFSLFYSSLTGGNTFQNQNQISEECIKLFKEEVQTAYSTNFLSTSFIADFLKSTQGFSKPIHYPRTSRRPQTEGQSFKWFVANEKPERRQSLGNLSNDTGLTIYSE
jgi:CRISPR-associated protein (TIGR03986 family)